MSTSASTTATIEVENLSKVFRVARKTPGLRGAINALVRPHYERKVAVAGISFRVEPGEVVGYIGVNGAGKSTTIKLLSGILLPSGGQVRVLGRDPYRQRIANAREIGIVFGQRTQLWWDLALIESLNLIAQIYQLSTADYKRTLDEFIILLDLQELLRTPVRAMSLGQKMRAELAATLIHSPRVVYLDEPTIGLDLIVKERIRAFLKQQNRDKATTVILATHDLGDIEELCQRVIVIDAGKLIYDGPLSAIRERFGKYRSITFATADTAYEVVVPPGATLEIEGERTITLRFDRTQTTASQVAAAVMNQAEVLDFTLAEPDLSTIVKQIYNGALRIESADLVKAAEAEAGVGR